MAGRPRKNAVAEVAPTTTNTGTEVVESQNLPDVGRCECAKITDKERLYVDFLDNYKSLIVEAYKLDYDELHLDERTEAALRAALDALLEAAFGV